MLCACEYCGKEYASHNVRRLYCSEKCRRSAQNERRRDARAEEREVREADHWTHDPWELMEAQTEDEYEAVWANCLLDASPCILVSDNPWGGPQFDIVPKQRRRKKERKPGQLCLPGVPH